MDRLQKAGIFESKNKNSKNTPGGSPVDPLGKRTLYGISHHNGGLRRALALGAGPHREPPGNQEATAFIAGLPS